MYSPKKSRYYVQVIRIRAEDSPNVRFAQAQEEFGIEPTGEILIPGVLSWDEYKKRRATWDIVRQTIGLDAQFYRGPQTMMYPGEWLTLSIREAAANRYRPRQVEGIGIDPGEGAANTAMAAVDRYGLVEMDARQTPDTTQIIGNAIAFINKHRVPAHKVYIDRGGGGKQLADQLRSKGYNVVTIAFGDVVTQEMKRAKVLYEEKVDVHEEKSACKNRRAEMYYDLRTLLDPHRFTENKPLFGIPADQAELLRQLSLMPLLYDEEGRIKMLPKNKRSENSTEKTLTELLGHSPDEADALVLAVHAMLRKVLRPKATAF